MEATSLESEVELVSWKVDEDLVRQYLEAVGDARQEYFEHSLIPPLALAAYGVAALLKKLNLPPGAIHSLQEVEILQPAKIGELITGAAHVEHIRRRGNLEFYTLRYVLSDAAGQQVQTGKTILVSRRDAR